MPMFILTLMRPLQRIVGLSLVGMVALTCSVQASADAPITFGAQQWPGITVKTEVASQILETLGYKTKVMNASTTVMLVAMQKKEADAILAIWLPAQAEILNPFVENGSVVKLTKNMTDLRYRTAVPQYVCDAGVTSLADLHKYPKRFDKKLYGIEAGDAGNLIMENAIKNNVYDLDGWRLVPSSTAAMLAQVKRAISRHEWIAFRAWEPHWMNVAFHICYLQDPKNIWGGNSTVYTVVRSGLIKSRPNVTLFLSQMVVPLDAQNSWTYNFGLQHKPLEQVAHKWIANHQKVVKHWIKDVTVKDSDEAASKALSKAFDWSPMK